MITSTWPRSCRPATSNSTTVYSRVLPVCQHRPVLYPLGIAANTIHQNYHADAINATSSTTKTLPKTPPKSSLETRARLFLVRFPTSNNLFFFLCDQSCDRHMVSMLFFIYVTNSVIVVNIFSMFFCFPSKPQKGVTKTTGKRQKVNC